jgi:hypothetical protein
MTTNPASGTEHGLDPRAALAAMGQSAAATRAAIGPNPAIIYFVWAAAYLIGYGLLHGANFGWLPLPYGTALIIGGIILLLAIAYTAIISIRSGSQIRGDSTFAGLAYGMSWMAGFLIVALFSMALAKLFSTLLPHADALQIGWLINAVAILVVSLMYMLGAALFGDRTMFILGACFTVLNAAALLAGPSGFISIFAICGPILLIIAGTATLISRRRVLPVVK